MNEPKYTDAQIKAEIQNCHNSGLVVVPDMLRYLLSERQELNRTISELCESQAALHRQLAERQAAMQGQGRDVLSPIAKVVLNETGQCFIDWKGKNIMHYAGVELYKANPTTPCQDVRDTPEYGYGYRQALKDKKKHPVRSVSDEDVRAAQEACNWAGENWAVPDEAMRAALEHFAAITHPRSGVVSDEEVRDAARYRHIRKGLSEFHGDVYAMTFSDDGDYQVAGNDLDKHIDAAIAQEQQA